MSVLKSPRFIVSTIVVIALMVASRMYFPVPLPHIQLPAETVFEIGGFGVTNTMIALLTTDIVLLALAFLATRRLDLVPSGMQNVFEAIIEFWQNTTEQILGERLTKTWLPLVLTIFLLIAFSNLAELIPGYDSIGIVCEPGHCPGEHVVVAEAGHGGEGEAGEGEHGEGVAHTLFHVSEGPGGLAMATARLTEEEAEAAHDEGGGYAFVPFLRVAASDLNFTLALALIAFLAIEIAGFRELGLGYLTKFINFKEGVIGIFVGLLEAVSELSRIISFAFRLFGNLFAGQTLLFVLPFLIPLFVVLPVYGLEMFVGIIQGFVFAILTVAFMSTAVVAHHGDDH